MVPMTETESPSRLSVRNLECFRGERRLFRNVSFDMGKGSLLQVLGPNGSGKTSLLRMVCGLLSPEKGEIVWNGTRVSDQWEEFKSCIAYVGHLNGIKEELNALENLRFSARLGQRQCDEASLYAALQAFGLEGFERLPCKVLSLGQRRRVALARLRLGGARPLWVLDEPFSSLDLQGVAVIGSVLEEHLARGGLALLTTHQDVPIAAPGMQTIRLGQ